MIRRATALLAALASLVAIALVGAAPAGAVSDGVWDYQPIGIGGRYQSLVGDFGGDGAADIFWYAPGSEPDSLWMGRAGIRNGTFGFSKRSFTVNGAYAPVVGDFAGDDHDDIFWYGPGALADTLWISDGTGRFTPMAMQVAGRFKPLRLRNYDDGTDDIFWYDAASRRSYHWDFAADGSGAHTSNEYPTWPNGTVLAGDWDGDGKEDVFNSTPGLDNAIWIDDTPSPVDAITYSLAEAYTPVVIYSVPRDGILFYGPGSTKDAYWRGTPRRRFESVPLTDLPYKGRVTTFDLDAAIVNGYWMPNLIFFDDGTTADFYLLKGREKNDERPIVGDFDDDGLEDILWYAAGPGADDLWYAEPAKGSASASAIQQALAVPTR